MKSPNWKIERSIVIAFLLYVAVAIVVFLPLVVNFVNANLTPYIGITQSRDRYHFMWNFWWVTQAISTHQNVLSTSMMFAPTGTSLALQTVDFVDAIIAAPVAYLFGYVAGFNFVIFMGIVLSGFTAFLLARHLTGSWIAGFGAGLIFALFPQHLNQALYGHPNLSSLEWIPAFLLAMMLSYETRKFRYAILAGILLGLVTLTELELLVMTFVVAAVYLFYYLIRTRFSSIKKFIAITGTIAGSWLLVSSAYLISAYLAIAEEVRTAPPVEQVYANAAKPVFYLTPPPASYLYSSLFSPSYSSLSPYVQAPLQGGAPQLVIFVGFSALALAIIGALTSKDSRRFFFLLLAAVAFVISLGPSMNTSQLSIQTPYTFLYNHLTVLQFFRTDARFSIVLELALAGLAAYGIDSILKISGNTRFPRSVRSKIIAAVILSLILIEFFPVVTVQPVAADNVYSIIKSDNSGYFTVLELPATITVAQAALYHQIYYQRPLVDGKISQVNTVLPQYMYTQLFLRILTQYTNVTKQVKTHLVDQPYSEIQLAPLVLSLYNIKYVIVNYNEYSAPSKAQSAIKTLETALGPPVYQDQNVLLFEVPQWVSWQQVIKSAPIVLFGNGWTQEINSSMSATSGANLYVYAPTTGTYTLQMKTTAQICPMNMNFTQGGEGCGSYDPSQQTLSDPMWLSAGENILSLQIAAGIANVSQIKVR
jgi:hypothetical protein